MDNIGTFGFKAINCEYIKSSGSVTKIDNYYTAKSVVKPGTKIRNGVLFRYVIRFYQQEKVTLDLIGEQVFIINDVQSFDHSLAIKIIQIGVDNCSQEFSRLYHKETGLTGSELIHTVKPAEGHLILELLKGKSTKN